MGAFNPHTPTKRGQDTWQPRTKRIVTCDDPTRAVLMRFKVDATTSPASLHARLESIFGSVPGLAVEYLDIHKPALTETLYYPGTDTGSTITGWQDQGGSTANFGEIDDFATDAYHRNTSTRPDNSRLDHLFRGSAVALTSATRVTKIVQEAKLALTSSLSNQYQVVVQGLLSIGGTTYVSKTPVTVPRSPYGGTGIFWHDFTKDFTPLAEWKLDPSTNLPWVSTSADNLWASTDAFGLGVTGKLAAAGFLIGGHRLRVYTCPENRKGFYYATGAPEKGWGERTMSSAGTLVLNSYIYVLVYALTATAQNFLQVMFLGDPDATWTTAPTETGEHRQALEATLHNEGGTIKTTSAGVGLELAPMLIDNGSIVDQSQPYADLVNYELADKIGGVAFDGTSGCYVHTADSAKLSITSSLGLAGVHAPDDLTPGSAQTLLAKWNTTGDQRSVLVLLTTAGKISLSWSTSGAVGTVTTHTSTNTVASVLGTEDGQGFFWRVSLDTTTGVTTFEVSLDGITWSSLGAPAAAGATSVFDSTAKVEIGGHDDGTAERFTGKAYRAWVFAGTSWLDVRADAILIHDAARAATVAAKLTDTTIGDEQGNTWTLAGAATWFRYGFAQQITTAAATSYLGVEFPVLWAGGVQPDAPLEVQVRSGAAGSGGGALLATGYVFPEDVPADGAKVVAVFSGGVAIAHAATTQYHVRFTSPASRSKGWLVPVGDTRSDDLGTGTTAADLHGASQNGLTDSFVSPMAIPLDRFDVPCALVAALTGASSLSATVRAAA